LGQEQLAAHGCGVVPLHEAFFHESRHRQAKDRFGCVNGVTACQRNARGVTHCAAAPDHFTGDFGRQHVDRPAENGDRHQRVAAHGVDVADGVGGGNHALFVIDGVDSRVVARGVADPQTRIEILRAAAGENGFQDFGRNLAAAPGAVTVLGKTNGVVHGKPLGFKALKSTRAGARWWFGWMVGTCIDL
nr:hypothetical protein [Tanacetum cinerariifolium]